MNFLPEEDKKNIKREYYRRLFVVFGLFSFFAIVIGIILLLPVIFLFQGQKTETARQIAVSQELLKNEGGENIVRLVQELNTRAEHLSEQKKNIWEASPLIKKILTAKSENIKIKRISLDEKTIVVQGISDTRQRLLSFIDDLKRGGFSKVESPLSNIIKDKDIDFTINIQL
jgi:hypothetical protein